MQYGKLEVPDIDFVKKEPLDTIKYTVENFSPVMEFEVDKMYTLLVKTIKDCDDCGFDTDIMLENSSPTFLLKVVEWTRDNVVEAKEKTLMECFYLFINFYTLFSFYRADIKKKSTPSLTGTLGSFDVTTV